jgi:2-dehydropantoate 2-reductase
MPILIFGAGAIGQWLGALLVSEGHSVQLHGRPRIAAAIAERGGISLNGQAPIAVPFSTDIEELEGQGFSCAICTVKTYAVRAALEELATANCKFGDLVSFQNGWGTEEHYIDLFPRHKLWTLTTTRAVGYDGPGVLTPSDKGGLAIAPWEHEGTASTSPVQLRRLPIPLVLRKRGKDQKWSKLLLNVMGNATGAVTGLGPREYADRPKLMRLELLLLREAMAVGKAMGFQRVELPGFAVPFFCNLIEKFPVAVVAPIVARKMRGARGDKLPSLFEDLKNPEAPSEIDHMNGAVVTEGARIGVPTPYQSLLMEAFWRCRREPAFWERLRNKPDRLADILSPATEQSSLL